MCFELVSKKCLRITQSNSLQNANVSELYEEHRDSQSYLSSLHNFRYLYSLQLRYLPVFTPSYIGIESEQAYAAKLLIYCTFSNDSEVMTTPVDFADINWPWRLLPFVGGMMIFLLSRRLTRHVAFYYSTGTIVGICGSLVIVVYMLQRLLPKVSTTTAFFVQQLNIRAENDCDELSHWRLLVRAVLCVRCLRSSYSAFGRAL